MSSEICTIVKTCTTHSLDNSCFESRVSSKRATAATRARVRRTFFSLRQFRGFK